MFAAVANLLLIAALILKLKGFLMKHRVITAGLAAASLALVGCNTLSAVSGRERSTEQRQADRETLALLLKHCDLTANFDMELGLSARSGVGLKAGGTCRPSAVPLRELEKVTTDLAPEPPT